MAGRVPTGPRSQRDPQSSSGASRQPNGATNGSMSPVGAPKGPKSMVNGGNGQRAGSPTSPNGLVAPSAPKAMLNKGQNARTNASLPTGPRAGSPASTATASKKAPKLSIAFGEGASASRKGASKQSVLSAFGSEREYDGPTASTSKSSASSSTRKEPPPSKHYSMSAGEAKALARLAAEQSQPSKQKEPSSAPPPPPVAASSSRSSTKIQPPKMALSLANGSTTKKPSPAGSKSVFGEGSSNALKQLGKTASGLDKGKQPEVHSDDVKPASPARERQRSARGKMFLPEHLNRDEIMAEVVYPRPDLEYEGTPPPRDAPKLEMVQDPPPDRGKPAHVTPKDERPQSPADLRAAAFLSHQPAKKPSLSPLPDLADLPVASTSQPQELATAKSAGSPTSTQKSVKLQENEGPILRLGPVIREQDTSDRYADDRYRSRSTRHRHSDYDEEYDGRFAGRSDYGRREESDRSYDAYRPSDRSYRSSDQSRRSDSYRPSGSSRKRDEHSPERSRRRSPSADRPRLNGSRDNWRGDDRSSPERSDMRERTSSRHETPSQPMQARQPSSSALALQAEPMARRISHPLPPKPSPPTSSIDRFSGPSFPIRDARDVASRHRESSKADEPGANLSTFPPEPVEPVHQPPPPPPPTSQPSTRPPSPSPGLPEAAPLSSMSISLRSTVSTKASPPKRPSLPLFQADDTASGLPDAVQADAPLESVKPPLADQPPTAPVEVEVPVPAEPVILHRNKYALYDPDLDSSGEKRSQQVIWRYLGEGLERPIVDPRLDRAEHDLNIAKNRRNRRRPGVESVSYEWDKNSIGKPPQPPAAAVCIMGLSALTIVQKVTQAFSAYGRIEDAALKVNKDTGGSLGICLVRFCDEVERYIWTSSGLQKRPAKAGGQDGHACAQLAVQRMHNQKAPLLVGQTSNGTLSVQLDGDGEVAENAAKAELKKRKEAEAAKRRAVEHAKQQAKQATLAAANAEADSISSASTPMPNGHAGSPNRHSTPQKPSGAAQEARRDGAASPARADQQSKKHLQRKPITFSNPWATSQAEDPPPSPVKVSPNRMNQRLPYRSNKISPGGLRLPEVKGKAAADSDSSSSEEEGSEDEDTRRQREKEDQVFFHGSRRTPQSATRSVTYLAGAKEDFVEVPDTDLRERKRVMIKLSKQPNQYLAIKKAGLKQVGQPKLKPSREFIVAILGPAKPDDILEDADCFYAVFRDLERPAYALRELTTKRNRSVENLQATLQDPLSPAEAEALPETRKIPREDSLPRLPEADLLRQARKLLEGELTTAVIDDLRNIYVRERVEDLYDHRTKKAEEAAAQSQSRQGSTVRSQEVPSIDTPTSILPDRPPRVFTKTAAEAGGVLPSFGKRQSRSAVVDADGWGPGQGVWQPPAPAVEKRSTTPVAKEELSPLKASPRKSPPKPVKTKKAAPEIVFTSSEEEGSDEEEIPLSEKLKKAAAAKLLAANAAARQQKQQDLRESSPLSAISGMTAEDIVAISLDKEVSAPEIVDIEVIQPNSSEIRVDTPEERMLTSAEAIASLPTPAPTESSTASNGKRELSVDVEAVEPDPKKARIASPDQPLSAIPPTASKAAPKSAKGKKGAKKGKKSAAAARAQQVDGPGTAVEPPVLANLTTADLGIETSEDLYYLKLALQRRKAGVPMVPDAKPELHEDLARPKHDTGSARTEGYYKIPQIEKLSYLAARNQARAEAGASSSIAVSRLARVNARHLASGLDKHKKSNASDNDILQFNQLRTRKKQMRFARSPIHDWGLYAMEQIPAGEMVIEYVGESIRQQVADKREKMYERQGIGSSYLFRVDDDVVIDATMKGNLGRLINHCCTPNCTARILSVGTSKKIVIFAKQPIYEGDEITYDYHFPIEDEKIVCLCGSSGCRGFLN